MAGDASKRINSLRIVEIEGRCPAWGSGGSSKYKEKIQEAAKEEFDSPYEVPVIVEIDLFYNSERNPPPDIDNAENLIFDSLKGVAFSDDKLVVSTKSKVHDTSGIMEFNDEPLFLTDLLMKGIQAYTVIRIHEK